MKICTHVGKREFEVKFMLDEREARRLEAVVAYKGNSAVAGYVRHKLLPLVIEDYEEMLADIEREQRAAKVLPQAQLVRAGAV